MRNSVGTSGHILIFTRLILKRTSVARAWSYFDIQNLRLVILYISDTLGYKFKLFSDLAILVKERLKSDPRLSEISLSCSPPGVRFYISYFFMNHNGHAFDVDENYDVLNIIIARKCLFLVNNNKYLMCHYIIYL